MSRKTALDQMADTITRFEKLLVLCQDDRFRAYLGNSREGYITGIPNQLERDPHGGFVAVEPKRPAEWYTTLIEQAGWRIVEQHSNIPGTAWKLKLEAK